MLKCYAVVTRINNLQCHYYSSSDEPVYEHVQNLYLNKFQNNNTNQNYRSINSL